MDINERLYEIAHKAIDNLFSDTSVPPSVAKINLQAFIDHLEILIDALKD
jgi:hypothetical protein